MPAALIDVVSEVDFGDVQIGGRARTRPAGRRQPRVAAQSPVLRPRLFREAMLRERRCADRFRSPFTVLLLEHDERRDEPVRWEPVLRALAAMKRDTDIVGWLQKKTTLGVILPESPAKAAVKFVRRLSRELDRRLGGPSKNAVSIAVYGQAGAGDINPPGFLAVDALIDAFVQPPKDPLRDAAKRCLDTVGAIGLLLLFAPVLLGIFAVVKATSPGPALFRQVRVGRRGEPFTMLKFRTMFQNAGHAVHQEYVTWFIKSSGQEPRSGTEVYKLTNDPRITPVGHFLRKTSLDELPQFWNVLRGDMSLVGPRPPLPFEVEQYQGWHRRRVLDAKPGVTGPWQVYGRSRTTFDEMVRLDLGYARSHSLWTDIKILAATPLAMVSGKGAA